MRKFILCIMLMLSTTSVHADTVAETTGRVMSRFNIPIVDDDVDNLQFYKNHGLVDAQYKPLLSSAVKAGVLIPTDGILTPESEDLLPVKNGIINFGLRNQHVKFTAGKFADNRIGDSVVNKDTVRVDALTEGELYTALVDRDNNVIAVWKPTELIQPTLYRGRLYVKAGDMMVVYATERKAFDMWIVEEIRSSTNRTDQFVEVDLTGTTIGLTDDEDVNEMYMDEFVYFVADGY